MLGLITRIGSSEGSYLAEHLVENRPEIEVYGISRWHSTSSLENLGSIAKKVKIHECDLNEGIWELKRVYEILLKNNPYGNA